MRLLFTALIFLASPWTAAAAEKPVVVLIGLDGFRWDYLEKYRPPNLTKLAAQGVHAERMIPVFPTATFPNFYTLATGLRPARHGIVSNMMFDPGLEETFTSKSGGPSDGRWWGGEPIWATAEKQGRRAACMFWPGSEAEIAGRRPSLWLPYSDDFAIARRLETVLDWLALPVGKRPQLITLYFHEADTTGHKYGPDSPEVAEAVATVDAALGELVRGVDSLGLAGIVDYVIVSDHGMTALSEERVIAISDLVDIAAVRVDFAGTVAGLRPIRGTASELRETLRAQQRHYRAFLREEIPEALHFRDNARIPPVVLVADEGWTFVQRPLPAILKAQFPRGGHGYEPSVQSMSAMFLAAGPSIKSGETIAAFENVEVYGLVCALLGLKPAPNDGDGSLPAQVLN